jgi:hypothetical protein
MIGQIPGVTTNRSPNVSVSIDSTYFRHAAGLRPAIQLHGPLVTGLTVSHCRFDSGPGSPPLVKSYAASADQTAVSWRDNYQTLPHAPVFEYSTGLRLTESSQLQARLMNRPLGLYSSRSLLGQGGSGFLLDALDASWAGPIARIGISGSSDPSFGSFHGGLLVNYDQQLQRPTIAVTNAELVVASPTAVPNSNSPGQPGAIRWDANYVYICVGTNLWKRAPLSSW